MKKINIKGKNNCLNKNNPKEDLIQLINELNSAIRIYYSSTMEIIKNFKKRKTLDFFSIRI